MVAETKAFLHRPVCLICMILFCIGIVFTLFQLPSGQVYDALYQTYQNDTQQFNEDYNAGLLADSNEVQYMAEQISYIDTIRDTISSNIETIKAKLDSSLFKDDSASLQQQLTYEEGRWDSSVGFENTYRDDACAEETNIVYLIYIVGLLFAVSIWFEDIKNGSVRLYRTTDESLQGLFCHKYLLFAGLMLVLASIGCCIELLLVHGSYSVYCIASLSDVCMDMTVRGYIILKYVNCFLSIMMLAAFFNGVLMLFRNEVISVVIVGVVLFVEYAAYGYISDISSIRFLRYINLVYWLFFDHMEYLSINVTVYVMKAVMIVLFSLALYAIYTRQYRIQTVHLWKRSMRSTDPCLHIERELLFDAKGLLAIAVIVLYGLYSINSFRISRDSKEEFYQSFKAQYLGAVTQETYDEICTRYDQINEASNKKQIIYNEIAAEPDKAQQLYEENQDTLKEAVDQENIQRLKTEYETAMADGNENFIDSRGADILLMKDQFSYFLQSLLIVAVPLIAACCYHARLTRQKERALLICTSSIGQKVVYKLDRIAYYILIMTGTTIFVLMHMYKVSSKYPIYYSNTLKDLLICNLAVPIWAVLIMADIIIVTLIYGIVALIMKQNSR